MNYPRMIYNMRNVLVHNGQLEQFKKYTPSVKTGYVYDTSSMIKNLKIGVSDDKHSDSSFAVCCGRLKKSLDTKISLNHGIDKGKKEGSYYSQNGNTNY